MDYVLIVMKSTQGGISAPRPCFCLSQRTMNTYRTRSHLPGRRHHHFQPRRKSLLLKLVSMHFQVKEPLKLYEL